jgi:5-methyltetrahydrofolate--homocysteine methyltransferase
MRSRFPVGFNCALGAKQLRPHVEELAGLADVASPRIRTRAAQRDGGVRRAAARDRGYIEEWAQNGWLNITGGCCGTTPDHIRHIAEAVARSSRGGEPSGAKLRLSGLEPLNVGKDSLFVNVGERTNVTGSKAFAPHPRGRLPEALSVARQQVEKRRAGDRREHGRGDARLGRGDDALPAARGRRSRTSRACRS